MVSFGGRACVGIDAAFQADQCSPAATECLFALDAPATGLVHAAADCSAVAGQRGRIVCAKVAGGARSDVDDAVQIDAWLCEAGVLAMSSAVKAQDWRTMSPFSLPS